MGITVCLFVALWVKHELSFDTFHRHSNRIFRISNTFTSESETFSQAISGPALGAQLPAEIPEIEAGLRFWSDKDRVAVGDHRFYESNILYADSNFFDFLILL